VMAVVLEDLELNGRRGDPAPTEFADAVDAGKAAIAKARGEDADG